MMKFSYLILLLFAITISFSSCNKDSDYDQEKEYEKSMKQINEQFAKDTVIIQKYLVDNKLTAVKDSSGIYYIVNEPGEGSRPNDYSYINVKYKGYLTNGTIFDQTQGDQTFNSYLNRLVIGWRIGIPLIGAGGKITLFLPSYYGYGNSAVGIIPSNSVLIFEIELVDFD